VITELSLLSKLSSERRPSNYSHLIHSLKLSVTNILVSSSAHLGPLRPAIGASGFSNADRTRGYSQLLTALKERKMANVQTMKLVSQYTTIWQQCWHPEICINIPFDGRKCLGADVCVAIVEENGTFYIEGSINGNTAKYALINACIPVYSVGIASLEICVTNLDISNGRLNSLTLSVKGCIGGSIAGIHLQQCWDLYNQTIKFHSFTAGEIVQIVGLDVDRGELQGPSWNTKFVTSSVATLDTDRSHCKCKCG
jgi:hypothetical protein